VIQLAGDLGYGIPWLVNVLIITIVVTTGFFIFVSLTPRWQHKKSQNRGNNDRDIKYKLYKYHAERYWAIFVAGILIWLWFLGYPWMPPVAFEKALETNNTVHLINVTAGQWFWQFQDGGMIKDSNFGNKKNAEIITDRTLNKSDNPHEDNESSSTSYEPIKIKVGETVKFVARSLDVNHGFGVLKSSKSMDSPLFQMQVVPGFDNVFYYSSKEPGVYTVRCLEYCGWNHPFMVSQITVE